MTSPNSKAPPSQSPVRQSTAPTRIVATAVAAALLVVVTSRAEAEKSYFGVAWSDKHHADLTSFGYNPEEVSRYMYERNDRCGKEVSSVTKDQQFVCIRFSCGFFTWSYVIDEWRKQGKVDTNGSCRW